MFEIRRDIMRDFAKRFYKSKIWQATRKAYASSVSGLCERCLMAGLYVPGEIVHHKIALTPDNINDPGISLNWDNLELLCRDCHGKEHSKQNRYFVDSFGHVTVK